MRVCFATLMFHDIQTMNDKAVYNASEKVKKMKYIFIQNYANLHFSITFA